MINKPLEFLGNAIATPLRAFIEWAEHAAHDDDRQAHRTSNRPPASDAPLTLDRISNIALRFFIGSRQNDAIISRNITRHPYHYPQSSIDRNVHAAMDLLYWMSTGIAFRRGFNWGITGGMRLFSMLLAVPGAMVGGAAGSLLGMVRALGGRLQGESDPFAIAITTGLKAGSRIGATLAAKAGYVIGTIPGAAVGAVVGLGAGVTMGAIGATAFVAQSILVSIAVAKVVFNPFAWKRGAVAVTNSIRNSIDRFSNWVKSIYREESREYYQTALETEVQPINASLPGNGDTTPIVMNATSGSPLLPMRQRAHALSRESGEVAEDSLHSASAPPTVSAPPRHASTSPGM